MTLTQKARHSSEKIDPAQMQLAVEAEGQDAILQEEEQLVGQQQGSGTQRRGGGRRPAPENLPIERVVIDVPESEREGMEKIREEVTEEIDYLAPANLSVVRSCARSTPPRTRLRLPSKLWRSSV